MVTSNKTKNYNVCIVGEDADVMRAAKALHKSGCTDFKHIFKYGDLNWLAFTAPEKLSNIKYILTKNYIKTRNLDCPTVESDPSKEHAGNAPTESEDLHSPEVTPEV